MNAPAPQPADPGYLAALGLQRAPFLDRIDDRFFYADPALVQRLDLLQHLTQFGDMLLGVLGPAGSGKSTLLQQFISRGGTSWRCCHINGAQIGTFDELLARLAAGFTVDVPADPERTKAVLLRHFQSLRHATQLPVILIDDAHQLPDPILKALLELGGNARETLKLIRIVLFAEPGLEQKLIQAGLHSPQQPLLHRLEMPGFDIQQSAAYLMYRLAVAGYSGDSPFSLTEIRALHKSADGLPGRLNVLAHETLMERAGRIAARNKPDAKPDGASRTAGATHKLKRLGLLGGVAGVAALAWYLLQSGFLVLPGISPEPEAQQPDLAQAPSTIPVPETPGPAGDEPPADEMTDAQTPEADGLAQEENRATEMPDESAEAPPAEPASAEPEAGPTDGNAPAASPDATPAPPAAAKPIDTEPSTTAGTATPAPGPAPAPTEPSTPTTAAESVAPQPEPAHTTEPAGTADRDGQQTATPPPETGVATAAAAPDAAHRESWLRERPPAHYTLQLLGVRSEASLRDYLTKNNPPGQVAYFRTDYKGGEWYVLVQGDYPSIAAARAAVASLPAAIRKAKPWPRSFASVHADIEKAGAPD